MYLETVEQNIQLSDFVSLTKKELAELVDTNIERWCENGDDTLSMLAMIAKIELYAADVKKKLAKASFDEVSKYGNEGVSKNGVKFDKFSSTRYDYTNSPAYLYVKAQTKPYEEQLKDIEQIAKVTKQKTLWVDSDGVELEIYPAIRTGSETVKCAVK